MTEDTQFHGDTDWIKELIQSERQLEEAGIVDFSPSINPDHLVLSQTVDLLKKLKKDFIYYSNTFNKLKGSANGQVKVYGIAKTHADFMLFRNGYKLVFNMLNPGQVQITYHNMATPFAQSQLKDSASPVPNALLKAAWGAFNEVRWINDSKPVNTDHLIKFYLRIFVQNSVN